jgi:PAS domain S-box-containing protein
MNTPDNRLIPDASTRLLIEKFSDAVIYTDRNFSILYLNKAAENIFEVNLHDVRGWMVDDVIAYEDVQGQSREQVLACLRQENHWSGETSVTQKGGKRLHLRLNITLVRDAAGKADHILLVCSNLTVTNEALELVAFLHHKNAALEAAVKQLQLVQVRFEAFMKHSPALTWIVDEEGNHLYANDFWKKTFGVTEQVEKFNLFDVFPADIATEYLKNNHRVLLANTATENLEPYVLPSGERRLCKVYKFPINNSNGQVWMGGIALDITDHVSRQDQLQASIERYRQVIKATSEAIWDWDVLADQVHRGEGFRNLFGTDLGTAPMEMRNSFVHPDDRERIRKSLEEALNSDVGHWEEEYRFLCLDGNYKICADRASIIRNRKGQATRLIGAMRDITHQRQLEAELRRKEIQRRQAISKAVIDAQEKERFEISFELHEQISQTLTTCHLLLEDLDCGEDQERLEFCRTLLNQSISNIRNISHRINPGTLQLIGLEGSLQNFIGNIGKDSKLQIELNISGLEGNKELPVELQLAAYRVVQEQLNNIRKHADATQVSIYLEVTNGSFSIEIKDNGKGFEAQQQTQGLGLANMQHRAEMHQGEMSIQSSVGKGTRLRVEFPFVRVAADHDSSLN